MGNFRFLWKNKNTCFIAWSVGFDQKDGQAVLSTGVYGPHDIHLLVLVTGHITTLEIIYQVPGTSLSWSFCVPTSEVGWMLIPSNIFYPLIHQEIGRFEKGPQKKTAGALHIVSYSRSTLSISSAHRSPQDHWLVLLGDSPHLRCGEYKWLVSSLSVVQ